MKVVHLGMGVIPVPPGDVAAGIEGYIYQLTRSLGKLGCVVHIIDIKGGEQQREKRSESSAVFHEVWHPPLPARSNYIFLQHFTNYVLVMSQSVIFALQAFFALNRLLSKEKIDIIHTHNRDTAIAAAMINKLRGKHNKELDSAEYLRILEQGEKEDLRLLLDSVGEKLPMDVDDREVCFSVPETYELIVECRDESDQKSKYEKLKAEGYKLRVLTL